MSDKNLQTTQAMIEAWNTHDLPHLLTFYTTDYEAADVSQAAPIRGREEVERVIRAMFEAFPDLNLSCDVPIVQGDRVAVAWAMSGTHYGKVMHIPPTRRRVQVRGISMLTLVDGQIARALHVWDVAGLLRAIGLLPDL